jgi:hypothetical protein
MLKAKTVGQSNTMKFKFTQTFTAECCGLSKTSASEHDVVDWLYAHIKRKHPEIYKKLDKNGRSDAQSQNGCGYFDRGTNNKSDGWFQAQAHFRESWRQTALRRMLDLDVH